MKTHSLLMRGPILASVLALAAPSAMAAWTFANGDLLLGFQATDGQGSTTNVFFNLGSGVAARDNPTQGYLGNIFDDLAAAYGPTWFSRTDLYFGVVGNLNSSPTSGLGAVAPVDGDPSRTFYISAPTIDIAGSAPHTGLTNNALGVAGNNFGGQETMVGTLNATASGAAVLVKETNPVEWANGWSEWNTVGGSSYNIFSGLQDSFGQGGSINYIDIQRILATTTGANPTGPAGVGTWVTTIGISSDGSIFAVPEPSTALMSGVAGLALIFRRRRAHA